MDHYFNLYLPSIVQGSAVPPGSKHAAYRVRLQRHAGFVANAKRDGHSDIKWYIGQYEQQYRTMKTTLARERIVIKHMYNQTLDYRLYAYHFSEGGWCLGICGYWLKHKRSGTNVFPRIIFNSEELETEKGAPIKLMSNQMKLIEHTKELRGGDPNSIPFQVKNVLDYIAGGRHTVRTPTLFWRPKEQPQRALAEAKRFYGQLAPRGASPEQKAADRFFVLHIAEGGSAHAMGLDMEAVEFFDPNFGVFTVANQSRQKLIEFLFNTFYPTCYPGMSLSHFYITRIE